jgi:NitT/TauT family transport system substrate-binding protein
MTSTSLRRIRVLAVLASSLLLAAVAPARPSEAQQPAASAKPDQVLLALDWVIAGQHSPFYVAVDKGFYAEQNLAVTISRGYGSGDTVKRIAAKQGTFGFADSGALIAARANDEVKVKALAAIYGEPGAAILYNAKKGIAKPKDLEGVTIAGGAGSATPRLFPAFAKANNLDASKVKWTFVEPASVNSLFATGRVDAVGLFVLEAPILRNLTKDNKDIEVGVMRYADHGLKFYGNVLIAQEDTIRTSPDLTRRFVAATIKGFDHALNNLDEAVAIYGKYHREPGPAQAKQELELVKALVMSDEARARGIGTFDPKKVTLSIELISAGLGLKRAITPEEYHTAEFPPPRGPPGGIARRPGAPVGARGNPGIDRTTPCATWARPRSAGPIASWWRDGARTSGTSSCPA